MGKRLPKVRDVAEEIFAARRAKGLREKDGLTQEGFAPELLGPREDHMKTYRFPVSLEIRELPDPWFDRFTEALRIVESKDGSFTEEQRWDALRFIYLTRSEFGEGEGWLPSNLIGLLRFDPRPFYGFEGEGPSEDQELSEAV